MLVTLIVSSVAEISAAACIDGRPDASYALAAGFSIRLRSLLFISSGKLVE